MARCSSPTHAQGRVPAVHQMPFGKIASNFIAPFVKGRRYRGLVSDLDGGDVMLTGQVLRHGFSGELRSGLTHGFSIQPSVDLADLNVLEPAHMPGPGVQVID